MAKPRTLQVEMNHYERGVDMLVFATQASNTASRNLDGAVVKAAF
jgi:hypothetical protein